MIKASIVALVGKYPHPLFAHTSHCLPLMGFSTIYVVAVFRNRILLQERIWFSIRSGIFLLGAYREMFSFLILRLIFNSVVNYGYFYIY